jgi:hypothetical protein
MIESQIDQALLRRAQDRLERFWKPHDTGPNYVDIIAADCGWNPLVVGEKMEVRQGDGRYEIRRLS